MEIPNFWDSVYLLDYLCFFQATGESKQFERKGNKQLLWENKDYAIDLFLIYILTLAIYPGFLSEDTGKHSLGTWYVDP